MGNLVGGLFTGVSERQIKEGSGNGVSLSLSLSLWELCEGYLVGGILY